MNESNDSQNVADKQSVQQGESAMRMKRKRILIIATIATCIAVTAAITLHRPKRYIVIEVEGQAKRDFKVILVVDGQRQMETAALPKTFHFYAHEVAYGVAPTDMSADDDNSGHNISGHMYLEDKSIDFSCTAPSVGGYIKSPRYFGIWTGDFTLFTGVAGSPFLAEPAQ